MTHWVTTSEAAKLCHCHPRTLKRKRDIEGGFLVNMRHWRFGTSPGSSIMWDIDYVIKEFNYRGYMAAAKLKDKFNKTKTAEDISNFIGA